jgi:tellurite resistance protein
MTPENSAIVKSLVSVAWADGSFGAPEREMLEALLVAFDASEEESKSLRDYAETKRTLDDVGNELERLSDNDLRALVQHAVLLTFIDGEQDPKEKAFVSELARYVGIGDEEASALISQAETRAKRNLQLL